MPTQDPPSKDLRLRHAAVTELQTGLLTTRTVEDFLQRVVDGAAEHIAPRMSCTLTMLRQQSFVTVASSDGHATAADQVEYEVDSGPCVDAARDGVESIITDLRMDDRWPAWQEASLRLGFLSGAAVPGDTGDGGALVSLNMYGHEVDTFGKPELRTARVYVEEVARALRLSLMLAQQATLAKDLETAMLSRSTIDQALGVIMGQSRGTRDQAFEVLRAASQSRNLKLREVAALVIQSVTGHPPADPPPFSRGQGSR